MRPSLQSVLRVDSTSGRTSATSYSRRPPGHARLHANQ